MELDSERSRPKPRHARSQKEKEEKSFQVALVEKFEEQAQREMDIPPEGDLNGHKNIPQKIRDTNIKDERKGDEQEAMVLGTNETHFKDENECRKASHSCHEFAECNNTPGGYDCKCKPGYKGDGFYCYGKKLRKVHVCYLKLPNPMIFLCQVCLLMIFII